MTNVETHFLTVHQALHGYADGHRLLASSLKLPREADRTMLLLSDLSGQVVCDGFETYLSGYPLRGTGLYVLARTWYAAEMPRPGCVWTHSLLVSDHLLARLRHPSVLARKFRRPSGPDDVGSYHDPIHAIDADAKGAVPLGGGSVPLRLLAEAFYRFPSRPVVLPVVKAADAEAPFLGLWDGQWESLRRSFTFCTTSSPARGLAGILFSLQGASLAESGRIARVLDAAVVDVAARGDGREGWLEFVVRDLETPGEGPFVEFLRSFNGHIPGERAAARPLAEVFGVLRGPAGPPEIRELLRIVADAFPEAEHCAELKSDLFGPQPTGPDAGRPALPEAPLLTEMAATDRFAAYDAAVLKLADRAAALARADALSSCQVLLAILAGGPQALGMELLRGLAAGVTDAFLQEALVATRSGTALLVGERPGLAAEVDSWDVSGELQHVLAEIVCERRAETAPLISGIVRAALEGGAIPAAIRLVASFGQAAAFAALDWYDSGERGALADVFARFLGELPDALLHWLESRTTVRPRTFLLVTNTLSPEDPIVQASLPTIRRYVPAVGSLPEAEFLAAMTWTFRLSLSAPGEDAGELAAASFDTVHRAAAWGLLEGLSWETLERLLPEVPWWKAWDRCERLRNAIRDRFVVGMWPTYLFPRITGDDAIFTQLVWTFRSTRSGRQFLRSLNRELRDSTSEIPRTQGLGE